MSLIRTFPVLHPHTVLIRYMWISHVPNRVTIISCYFFCMWKRREFNIFTLFSYSALPLPPKVYHTFRNQVCSDDWPNDTFIGLQIKTQWNEWWNEPVNSLQSEHVRNWRNDMENSAVNESSSGWDCETINWLCTIHCGVNEPNGKWFQ